MKDGTRIERHLVGPVIACGFAALVALSATSTSADPLGAGGGAILRLNAESLYQQGCFPPCRCPIVGQDGIRGTLVLRHLGEVEGVQRYAVDDVNLTVPLEPPLRIIGAGRYSVGSPGMLPVIQHRMELDLALGDKAVQHFDSGWVTVADPGKVSITVSLNNMYCQDTAIFIDASAVPEEEIQRYKLVQGSTFQRGCFDPCDCPLGRERPMMGTFALVPLTESLPLTEFAVADVRWGLRSDSSPATIPVTGFGVYQLLGDFVLQHRLALDLVVGSEPRAHFDSGPLLDEGGLPGIDIVASLHGGSCYDTVLHVMAVPVSGKTCGGIAGLPCGRGEFCQFPVGSCCCDHFGACTTIPDACISVWDPVCGCDGVTYGNECEAEMAGVSLAYYGPCGKACFASADCDTTQQFCRTIDGACGTSTLPGVCTTIPDESLDVWDPVCGCDGVTYRNELEAAAAAASIRHRGACQRAPRIRRHMSPARPSPPASGSAERPSRPGG